jgi:PAS domain S-box-containing protein
LIQETTDRMAADAERSRLATAVEQAAEGVFLLDLDKTITYANPAARELYGFGAHDLIGQKMNVFGSGRQPDGFWADLWSTVKSGEPWTGRVINRHRDGRTIQVDAVVSPVYGQSGQLTAFVASHRDVTERVAGEAERGRLVAALEQIGDAVFIFDRDRKVVYTNGAVEQMYGYASDAFSGRSAGIIDSDRHDATFWDVLWGTVEAGRTWSGRIVNRHRDGHEVTVESTISPIVGADGLIQGFIASDRDVTERIATETERARLVSALEQAAEGIFILEPDLVVAYANEAGARMYGYRREELIGRMLTVIDSGVHEEAFFETIYATTKAGHPWLGTVVNRHRDGHLIEAELVVTPLVDSLRNVTGVIESHRDVTERTTSEAERVRLASAVEQAADGIFILEPNGTVAYVNRSATRIYGYSREEFVGRDMRLLDSGAHPPQFFEAQWADVLAGRTWSGSITKRHRDGSLVQVESVITPMSDSKGRLTGLVESHRDVTRERALEDALEREARERESIEAAIRDIDPTAPPEQMAAAATIQILQLRDVGSAGVLDLTPGHEMTVGVAGLMGAVFGPGGPISAPIADALRARLAEGPWVQDVSRGSLDPTTHVPPGEDWPKTVAYAPFHGPGGSFGAIAIATHDSAAAERFAERVPALTAFASLLGAQLGPALDARHRDAAAHTAVQESLDPSAFTPFFQPIVALDSRLVAGYEALTRFAPSNGDLLGPIVAFAAAARVGLGLELEIVTLRAALVAADVLPPEAFVSLNVSPELLMSGRLAELLAGHERQVVLEITEHVAISDYAGLRRSLIGLGPRVRLAVDDAGAGFASFRHILELAPDFVKLDIDLVRGIDTDPARQALVAGMPHFATDRGLHLIAEGIETKAELATLRSLGLEFGQGYLLGRPRDSRRTRKWSEKVRLRAS